MKFTIIKTSWSGQIEQVLSLLLFVTSLILSPIGLGQVYAADPAEAQTVGRVISQRDDLSAFLKVLEKTELGSDLAERTNINYTVFVPSNKAFESLPEGAVKTLLDPRNDDRLEEVFSYHVLRRAEPPFELEKYTTLQMINGQWLSINYREKQVGDANFTGELIPCSNGVIYVIDQVLTPTTDDLYQVLQKDGRFTIFTKAITASRQGKLYQNVHDNYTVFAPTDQAFQNLADLVGVPLSALFDPAVIPTASLQAVLGTHVLGAIVPSADVTNGAIVDNIVGINTLKLTVKSSGDVFVNQAQVTAVDVNSDNGVVHVINSVLLPDETVVDVAIDNGFSSLATAVITAELMPALTDPYNLFTVFAPTNDAFDNLATALGTDINGLLALPNLADILLYHVVGGAVLSTDLTNGNVPTLNGADITVDLSSGVMINDAMVTTADVLADNGVVHIIDKVLLPGAGISEESIEVSIYPNPATEKLYIESSADVDFYITDLSGSVVKTGTTGVNEISISNLKSGAYLIHTSGSQNGQVYRFIKQ